MVGTLLGPTPAATRELTREHDAKGVVRDGDDSAAAVLRVGDEKVGSLLGAIELGGTDPGW